MSATTLDAIKKVRPLRYIETAWGSLGIRTISAGAMMELKRLPCKTFEENWALNRLLIQHCVADPKLDEEAIAAMEEDAPGFESLAGEIIAINGLSGRAQVDAKRTFPAGDGGAPETPAGG